MHPSTEDLLSLRDNEPMDAAARARLEKSPEASAEVERLNGLRDAMRALPELAPPSDAWRKIAAAVEPSTPRQRVSVRPWQAGAVVAATAAFAALLLIVYPRGTEPPGTTVPAVTRAAPPATIPGTPSARMLNTPSATIPPSATTPAMQPTEPPLDAMTTPSYAALVEESVRLEQLLAGMPYQRPIMTAGTASTIAALEDRISFIDGQLTLAAVEGIEPPQRQALWRERVDVMNALLQVRFAQAQPFRY